MTLITKKLCIPVGDSTIIVILLVVHISARYRIPRLLLLRLMLLDIQLRRKFNWRDGGIIGRLGVTAIGGYLIEIDVLIGVSGTAISIRFGLEGGLTDVNIIYVTALHHITTPSFVLLDMFDI